MKRTKKSTLTVDLDTAWFDDLSPHLFLAIRNLAERWLRQQPDRGSLRTIALANEAFIRAGTPGLEPAKDPLEFALVVSRAIRAMLVERAKTTRAPVSAGAEPGGVTLDAIKLDALLTRLRREDPLTAEVAELTYFAGLSLDDVAQLTGRGRNQVRGDWNAATLWIRKALNEPVAGQGGRRKKP